MNKLCSRSELMNPDVGLTEIARGLQSADLVFDKAKIVDVFTDEMVACGTNDVDILAVIEVIGKLHGGLAVTAVGRVLRELALPVAGSLSTETPEQVAARLRALEDMAKSLGCILPSPFATLPFLALPSSPS